MLAPDVPNFKVHVWKGDGGNILADGGYGFEFWGGVGGEEEGFYLFVEGGFAGVVEAEEEDGVFYEQGVRGCGSEGGGRDAHPLYSSHRGTIPLRDDT